MTTPEVLSLLTKRGQGEVRWLSVGRVGPDVSTGAPRDQARALLGSAGLSDVADVLSEVDADRARFVLVTSLRFDLAYEAEVMSEHDADAVASSLLGALDGVGAQYFTNRLEEAEPSDRVLGYDRIPLSDHTFDSVVIGVGPETAVLICVLDED